MLMQYARQKKKSHNYNSSFPKNSGHQHELTPGPANTILPCKTLVAAKRGVANRLADLGNRAKAAFNDGTVVLDPQIDSFESAVLDYVMAKKCAHTRDGQHSGQGERIGTNCGTYRMVDLQPLGYHGAALARACSVEPKTARDFNKKIRGDREIP